jgi:isopentenyl-diphosphate delta-isomerase
MQEIINLVNTEGHVVGNIEKLEAHEKGLLHEAFSVFIFNKDKELLLQKRALNKYHSGGLWTNTCCSHPRAGEDLQTAVHRRMIEEMGFDILEIKKVYSFIYKVPLDKGLIEHEYDHVLVGEYDNETIKPNPEEVCDYKWLSIESLKNDVGINPSKYTEWIKIIIKDKQLTQHLML